MNLNSVHVILTYRCTRTCPHCFHFGSPDNEQVMTFAQMTRYIRAFSDVEGIGWVFFEGGEPTLYFPLLLEAIKAAKEVGLKAAVVTNGYWITSIRDTIPYFKRFRDVGLNALQISCDELHQNLRLNHLQADIVDVARKANVLCQYIGVSPKPADQEPAEARRGETIVSGHVAYRGRAAHRLLESQATWHWESFDECPHEELPDPYRLHVDPYGHVMVCQGIAIGNLERNGLGAIIKNYDPDQHPVVGPLIRGGPAALMKEHELDPHEGYVDACHLCYTARRQLRRGKKLTQLNPGVLYGGGRKRDAGGRKANRSGPGRRGGESPPQNTG
jgi:hypothetical protein